MQLMLPLFPVGTVMISDTLGVGRNDEIVTYLHCGLPIYSHRESDYRSFRFITSKFILEGLCKKIDICNSFHVSYDSVKRYVRRLEKCGDSGFFTEDKRNGGSRYKLLPVVIDRVQKYLDAGKNNCEIARIEQVSEGTIRYALRNGILKKSPPMKVSSSKGATEPSAA
jgi:transposase